MHTPARLCSVLSLVAVLCACAWVRDPHADHGVIELEAAAHTADYWIAKVPVGDAMADAAAIAAQNERLRRTDPSVNDIESLPDRIGRERIRGWIDALSKLPASPRYDEAGERLSSATLAQLRSNAGVESIPLMQPTRYGLVTHRADLRAFPTRMRVFSTSGSTDIDRFQESALFPGTPVAIVHASADGEWWFVVSELYEAWIEKRHVAVGSAAQVFGYARKSPFLVVTGDTVRTNFTPEQPQVSELVLDMGVRVPLLSDWPHDRPVNGQHPHAAHVIELPTRSASGALEFTPALLRRDADVAPGFLPLNGATLLRQAFKFLGERYGWGHAYSARDCSGFVSEVYRSAGVTLPRNTGDQARSSAFERFDFDAGMDHAARLEALRALRVGDLIYTPGHVMMYVGTDRGSPHVIHDTAGINYRGADGKLEQMVVNGVVVTPLALLRSEDDRPIVDRITSIQRIRP